MRLKRDPIGIFQEPDPDGPIPQPGDTPPPHMPVWRLVAFMGALYVVAIAADRLIPPYGWWGTAIIIVFGLWWSRKP